MPAAGSIKPPETPSASTLDASMASRAGRRAFTTLGCLFVGLGVVGVALPLLPTTPFMLLAAACFARGSERLHRWLLGTRMFGPTIRSWQDTRTIPLRSKALAIAMITLLMGATIIFLVTEPVARMALAATGVGVIVYLLRVPTRPPARDQAGVRLPG